MCETRLSVTSAKTRPTSSWLAFWQY